MVTAVNEFDYELGFMEGEHAAWQCRAEPLPPRPETIGDRARGFWDARLPRTSAWARRHPISQAWWEDRQHLGAR
jgi:hypothetical protein